VNLNGKTLSTDIVAGTGTIRNAGDGAGLLAVGAGNGSSTLDGSLALLDGASGSLGLAKRGTGTLSILAAQTFSGGLAISGGTVFVNNTSGSGTGTGEVSATGGKLAGDGMISGAVSIYDPAAISPGTTVGKLTINNTLTLSGNTLIDVDKAAGTNDQIVATTVNYGGTLTATSLSGALNAGDSFVIFRAGTHTGDFASIAGTPGDGLEWRFDPATGVLSVVSVVVNPPTLLYTVDGSALTFTWAEAGFRLQAQTNSLSTGIGTDWADVPGGESSGVIVPIDLASPCVFFRLAQ
jgi:autotransporter-associated beta strand protein